MALKRLYWEIRGFFKDVGFLFFIVLVASYIFIAPMVGWLLGLATHPLAILLPLIPPIIVAVREEIRRNKVVMSEAFEVIDEAWERALNDYIRMVKKEGEEV